MAAGLGEPALPRTRRPSSASRPHNRHLEGLPSRRTARNCTPPEENRTGTRPSTSLPAMCFDARKQMSSAARPALPRRTKNGGRRSRAGPRMIHVAPVRRDYSDFLASLASLAFAARRRPRPAGGSASRSPCRAASLASFSSSCCRAGTLLDEGLLAEQQVLHDHRVDVVALDLDGLGRRPRGRA